MGFPFLKGELMKVKFVGCSKEQIMWGSNDALNEILEIGKMYEVEKVETHSWHTKYYLKEFPGKKFNSVCFEIVEK